MPARLWAARSTMPITSGEPARMLQPRLSTQLSVTVHAFSASAREKIESAGGTATALREPVVKKRKRRRAKPVAAEASTPTLEEEPATEPAEAEEAESPAEPEEESAE